MDEQSQSEEKISPAELEEIEIDLQEDDEESPEEEGTAGGTVDVSSDTTEKSLVDLDRFTVKLLHAETFWSLISRRVTKIRTRAMPTAGVTIRRGEFVMLWNDEFFSKLADEEVIGVLKHEFSHLIYEHVTSRRRDDHELWNIATDLAINSLIPENQLPSIVLLPGREFKFDPAVQAKMTEEQKRVNAELSAFIKELPKEMASDWYYDRLVQSGMAKKLQDCAMKSYMCGQMDSHSGWEELSESERDMMRGKLREIVERAVREADSSNAWGHVPVSMREYLRRFVSREVDWRSLLRNFIGNCRSSTRATTMRRINRRFPYVHPGVKKGYRARLLIAIDQSGSVDDHSLEIVFAELASLSKIVEFTVVYFDTLIDENSKFTWQRGQVKMPERTRCGGTDFNAPTEYVNKHSRDYDGLMIITDGECAEPVPSLVKRGWLIVPGRKLLFETKEIVCSMTKAKKLAA